MGHAKHGRHPRLTAVVDLAAALALPVIEWFDDLTSSERVYQIARGFLLTVLAVVAIAALSACQPGLPSTPPATTGSVPTDRPEEDEPGWICTAADDACETRL